jgi:hypothetical protein
MQRTNYSRLIRIMATTRFCLDRQAAMKNGLPRPRRAVPTLVYPGGSFASASRRSCGQFCWATVSLPSSASASARAIASRNAARADDGSDAVLTLYSLTTKSACQPALPGSAAASLRANRRHVVTAHRTPVAQLDRALPSEGRGHKFESCRARQISMTYGNRSEACEGHTHHKLTKQAPALARDRRVPARSSDLRQDVGAAAPLSLLRSAAIGTHRVRKETRSRGNLPNFLPRPSTPSIMMPISAERGILAMP